MFGGKIGTAYQEEWRAVASADKPVPSPASFGQQWGLSSLHCSAAVAAAVMTALVSSPVCFGGGTVLNVLRVLNVLYVLWSAPPPLAEDAEDAEDVEDAGDSGRRRKPKNAKPNRYPFAGEHRARRPRQRGHQRLASQLSVWR